MEPTPSTPATGLRKALSGRRGVAIGVGAAAIVATAVLVPVVLDDPAVPAPTASAPTSEAPPPTTVPAPAAPTGFVEFHSPAGFSLAYPAAWSQLRSADPQVPLVANQGPNSFLVRVVELSTPVGARELPAAKELTDKIVLGNESVKLQAQPKAISLSGLPGYFYFYTYTDRTSGLTGAHSHFFLFKGKTMIVLVFESLPADAFPAVSSTFDQISGSFRAE